MSGEEIIKIAYPDTAAGKNSWAKNYGMNAYYAGKHWTQRRKDAAYWHQLTYYAIIDATDRKTPHEKPVEIYFYWNDKLDLDNHAAIGKMIVDGMKGILIEDDSRKYIYAIHHYWHKEDFIKIIVAERS